RDHFFDAGDTADRVSVHLGLNGASGTGAESLVIPGTNGLAFSQVSIDTLISIENVTGTAGPDEIVGNEQDNVLEGRGGNDVLDGGLGNDTLIGDDGSDTASYASHDLVASSGIIVNLGVGTADGSATALIFVSAQQFIPETDILRGIENVSGS